jgi:orotate phosphoribosyltransferase
MSTSELIELARAVDARCRLRGEFVLRSGQMAAEYFDKYLFESDPALLRRVVTQMVPLIPRQTELLGWLELGGVPLATMLSSITGIPTLFVRKEAKTYGTRRLAEGESPRDRVVLLVEDVIATGGAVRNAALALRDEGAAVTAVVCAIDRSDPGTEPLRRDGLDVHAVMTKDDLDSVAAP